MDDLYPSDGSYFQPTEPEAQKIERKKSESKALAAVPLLKDLVKRLQDDIDLFKSVESIHVDASTETVAFLQAWHVQQELMKYVTKQKEYIESLIPDNLR